MNVDYINPFINSAINVLNTMAGIKAVPGKPGVRRSSFGKGDIHGFIGLNGHGINGFFIISFTRTCINEILSNIADAPADESLPNMSDAVGELTNMISGGAKATLSQKGFFFDVAVPSTGTSRPDIPEGMKGEPVIIVPFQTGKGNFYIEACISKVEEDFREDHQPWVEVPDGMLTVKSFAEKTGMAEIKIRRFLKTGFLSGTMVSPKQWHIPEQELSKIQVVKTGGKNNGYSVKSPELSADMLAGCVSVKEFAAMSGLASPKIRRFLRSGFIEGFKDSEGAWHVKRDQISKFIRK
ncbi:MAG: chemotaxis protein CheX [Desulfobacteraceae bacterium]